MSSPISTISLNSGGSIIILTTFLLLHSPTAESKEQIVGGVDGWAVPPATNLQFYNDWASRNRFLTNDTLRFQYQKESVMAVAAEDEYEKCRSPHPTFFANNGNTSFALDRPGLFYFISGVAGHCKRGLKMTVKVLEPQSPPHAAVDRSSPSSGADAAVATGFIPAVSAVFVALKFCL